MEQALYHVLLDGRKVGPYDRRTIVGMRIKKALTSADVLVAPNGSQLTVAELIKRTRDFQPLKSTSFSIVQARMPAALVASGRGPVDVPRFQGEVEMRVQRGVLRIAGQHKQRMSWKHDRIKIPLDEVVHAAVRGSLVELGIRNEGGPPQRVTFELFTPEQAGDFVDWLPEATPFPHGAEALPVRQAAMPVGLIVAVVGVVLTMLIVLAVLLLRR